MGSVFQLRGFKIWSLVHRNPSSKGNFKQVAKGILGQLAVEMEKWSFPVYLLSLNSAGTVAVLTTSAN